MDQSEYDNLMLVGSTESVDSTNARFYGRYPFPPLASAFDAPSEPLFEEDMIGQSLGYWDGRRLEQNAKIWVAGCGTNQAIFTALRFPHASVLGSDLSTKSLDACADTAAQRTYKS